MLSKYFWQELVEGYRYWVLGRPHYGYFTEISLGDRLDELKSKLWRLYRRALLCPLGKHYVKWNSGDPKCILCKRRYSEIFK